MGENGGPLHWRGREGSEKGGVLSMAMKKTAKQLHGGKVNRNNKPTSKGRGGEGAEGGGF